MGADTVNLRHQVFHGEVFLGDEDDFVLRETHEIYQSNN